MKRMTVTALVLCSMLAPVGAQRRAADLVSEHVAQGREPNLDLQNRIDEAFKAFEGLIEVTNSAAAPDAHWRVRLQSWHHAQEAWEKVSSTLPDPAQSLRAGAVSLGTARRLIEHADALFVQAHASADPMRAVELLVEHEKAQEQAKAPLKWGEDSYRAARETYAGGIEMPLLASARLSSPQQSASRPNAPVSAASCRVIADAIALYRKAIDTPDLIETNEWKNLKRKTDAMFDSDDHLVLMRDNLCHCPIEMTRVRIERLRQMQSMYMNSSARDPRSRKNQEYAIQDERTHAKRAIQDIETCYQSHCLRPPEEHPETAQACQEGTPQEQYVRGFQEGFVGCVVSVVMSPIALMNEALADWSDQTRAAGALLRGDLTTAEEVLHIEGERKRQQFEAMLRSLNPDALHASPLEAGRRVGSRICQFAVLPAVTRGVMPKKTPAPPEPLESPPMFEKEYFAALRLPFPSRYASAFASIADEIARRASAQVAKSPRFIEALRNGDIRTAGTLFHSAAKEAAEQVRGSLPEGWKMFVEKETIDPKGDAIRPDLYFRGPCGELVIFDWKTSARSALQAIAQMENYMGTLQWQTRLQGYPGAKVLGAQSVSWIDYVRPMVPRGLLEKYQWR